jgi:hypothetical protein
MCFNRIRIPNVRFVIPDLLGNIIILVNLHFTISPTIPTISTITEKIWQFPASDLPIQQLIVTKNPNFSFYHFSSEK